MADDSAFGEARDLLNAQAGLALACLEATTPGDVAQTLIVPALPESTE